MLSQGFIKAISKKNRSHTGLFVIMASLCLSSCGEGEKISLDDHMEQALSWQSDGNLKAAVIELKNTLIDYPDSGDARFLLGRVYLELGIGFAAEKEFEKAGVLGVDENITLFPLAESWLLQGKFDTIIEKISYDAGRATSVSLVKRNFLGAAYLSKGEIKTAEIYFDEVLEVAPRNMRALVGKARINFFRNNTEEMNEYVALAKAIHPNDRELLQLEASRSWSTKDFVAAEGFYRNLVKHYPSFYVNEINLAWVEIINGKLEEAGKILTKYRKTAPENILVNFVSALHAIIDKNYLGAKTYTEKVLAKAPGDIRTKYIAAMATFALDENEQSFAYIQQYLRVFPENLEAKELLVQLQIRLNKNEDAYETLKDISAQSEKKEKFLNMLASYELKKGDIEQARLHLEQSLAENPDQMTSRQKLAYLKIYGGEVSEGIGEMERALKDIPDDYQRTMRQARTLIIAKKYEDAVVLCHELQSSDPDNMNGYLCEATALFKKGDFQESLPLLTKVLDKEPGNLVASRQAIAAHLQNKSLEKAEDVQRKYLVVNPRDAKSTFGMYILQLMAGRKDVAIEYLRKSVK
ncbi:MAG: tetratricopeptide repeat protein, partial [Emcibacter sp.]|nr:tetratricopeptide repeat protein [Emcibacter sp.]